MAEHLNHPFKEDNTVYTMGLAATLSPFSRYNSSSRMQMVTGHRSHEIVPRVPDIPRCLTGFEDQLAGFTFNITMPHNAEVISIHRKYITGGGYGSIQKNPVTTVIYQNADTGEYDCIDITEYFSTHETFGVKLELTRVGRSLYRGLTIPKGTVLAEAPTCKDGIYRNGLHTQVVYIDDPAADEDGFRISDEYAMRMSPLEIGTSVCEWGKQCYPLNIYGDENNYKPHPDIGETIRDDAIVFATRTYHPLFDAIEMLPRNLSRIDYIHDKRTYAPGMEGATVHDVKVESGIGEARVKVQTPEGMGDHSKKYIDGLSIYYDEIIQCYKNLCQMNHFKPVAISPRLQKLIVSALGNEPNKDKSFTNHANKKTKNVGLVRRCYKGTPLDEYRVELHFNKWKIINNGAKITDMHGGFNLSVKSRVLN